MVCTVEITFALAVYAFCSATTFAISLFTLTPETLLTAVWSVVCTDEAYVKPLFASLATDAWSDVRDVARARIPCEPENPREMEPSGPKPEEGAASEALGLSVVSALDVPKVLSSTLVMALISPLVVDVSPPEESLDGSAVYSELTLKALDKPTNPLGFVPVGLLDGVDVLPFVNKETPAFLKRFMSV